MKIKSILVTSVAPMSDHAANRGEKLLGNASSVKRRPDGRAYISGQMQRHVLFSAIERLNEDHPGRGNTYVANGDGPSTFIDKDLRSDLGGFLSTSKGTYSGRRTAPVTATPAVAIRPSAIGRDLLIRLKMNQNEDAQQKQALATNEFSSHDEMVQSFHLDVGAVGITKEYVYENESHVKTVYKSFIDDEEHQRRIELFLNATSSMTDYANQARNATSGEPNRVLIVMDPVMSRKATRFFQPETSDAERSNILNELKARGAQVFLGDDSTSEGYSVSEAYSKALETIQSEVLYRPDYEQVN